MRLLITRGVVLCRYDDGVAAALKRVGTMAIHRASHVEPVGDQWSADMTPSGKAVALGPHARRREALDAEQAWVDDNLEAYADVLSTR